MKKTITIALILLFVACTFIGTVTAANSNGPAPNSGDGVSDGSGLEPPYGNTGSPGMGPAPNSGDGIPDGSGF